MQISQIIKERRTTHDYQPNFSVSIDILKKAIEMAIYAPNHKLTFPWSFSISGAQSKKMLTELALNLLSEKEPITEDKKNAVLKRYDSVSHIIAVGQKKSTSAQQSKEDYASVACGVQNMCLYLWDKGIGTKWSTGKICNHTKTYNIFKVDPEWVEIVGLLWVGKPLNNPPVPKRPSIDYVATFLD